jgi:hypothetical protein
VKNPWPGQQVEVVSGIGDHAVIIQPTTDAIITVLTSAPVQVTVQS